MLLQETLNVVVHSLRHTVLVVDSICMAQLPRIEGKRLRSYVSNPGMPHIPLCRENLSLHSAANQKQLNCPCFPPHNILRLSFKS